MSEATAYAPLSERLAPLAAVAVAVVSQALLRDRIVVGPRLLAPVAEVALALLIVLGETAFHASSRRLGYLRYALALALTCSATGSAALLIHEVVHEEQVSVQQLLGEGVQILVVLVVGFALLFWQLDRGGPNGRVQPDAENMSFWFTQDAIREYSDEFDSWRPRFLDYLYLAYTNLLAFSPTDTMPLSRTAKMLMVWESVVAFVTMAVLLARAVNILT